MYKSKYACSIVAAIGMVFALSLIGTRSEAQVTAPDGKCRVAIQKNAGKLGTAANKAIDACIKSELKAPTGADCNNATPDNPVTDAKSKISKAAGKLRDAVGGAKTKCDFATHPAVLGQFPSCPSPANADDDGGTNATGIDASDAGFDELAECQVTINTEGIETLRRYVLAPDAAAIQGAANSKDIVKCANAIAKNTTKLWSTISKERGKCQATSDKDGGAYAYGCSTFDGKSKIAKAVGKLEAAVQKACGDSGLGGSDLGLIHTCDTDVAGINACVANAVMKNASGATATAFEFAGVCPNEVRIAVNSGTGVGGRLTNTKLDTGWTGLGHRVDVVDGFVGRVNLDCSGGVNGGADCESCAVTSNCEAGNCRCSNNQTIQCNSPFVEDVCGAGNTCVVAFGPPLPLSAGGSPVCVTNTIFTELVGTADVGTGASTTQVNDVARVFLGLTQSSPCPTCSGATVGAAGTCTGGANNGAACVTNAIHPDFGATSYQCQPALASNISGTGLKVDLSLTDGVVSLPFDDACDSPLGAVDCACGVCSGDNSVGCVNDAECADLGLGTCEKGSNGEDRRPNSCASIANCVDQGDETGLCQGAGESDDLFCSGFVRKGGGGIVTCSTDADCDAVDGECPGGDCGTCTLSQPKNCFLDPIVATGVPGQDGAELVSTFCSPPTVNVGINAAGGIPGAGRVLLDWDFNGFCPSPNDTREFELGGSNCN